MNPKTTTENQKKIDPPPPAASLFASARPAAEVTRPWQKNPVGFAVVGLGMGHSRAQQVAETPGARLVGVCDLNEERAKRTAETCGVPYSLEFRDWLENDEVEVIYVMTETGRHAEIALAALAAGKHVLTTKPMEANLEACDAMIRAAEKHDRLLAVDFGRRFTSDLPTLRQAVRSGRLGTLLSGSFELKILRTMEYFQSNGGWRGTRRWDGGGVLSNQSIHHIDEIAYTVGIPEQVRCLVWTQNHDIEAEDLGTAVWRYPGDLILTFTATTNYPHATWFSRFELTGSEGAFFHASGGPLDAPLRRWFLDGSWSDTEPEIVMPEWLNAADNMAAAIRSGAALTCPGRDGRRTQSILDAMYRSACEAGGDWVEVKPDV